MKRKGNLYEEFISEKHWQESYEKALAGKVNRYCVKRVLEKGPAYLENIRQQVINGTFEFKGYKEHTIYEPKERKIYVARIAERIYHWACMIILERVFEPTFIFDSYSCRKNKGQHKCSRRCYQMVQRNNYCLKLDISKFYPSINHKILKECLIRKIKDKKFLEANFKIIDSHNKNTGTGIPIGNYSSQIFGNIYMTKLDRFVKDKLKCKDYLRYCDDFCLFSNDKTYLNYCKYEIIRFVTNDLKMNLSKCSLFKVRQGVDFVGYRHFKNYILVRKRTAKAIKARMKKITGILESGIPLKARKVLHYFGQTASAFGWCKHANAFNFINKFNILNNLEVLKMKFEDICQELTYYKERKRSSLKDLVDKRFLIIAFALVEKKKEEDKEALKLKINVDGEERQIITKSSVIIRDLKQALEYQRENNIKVFPLDVLLRKSKNGNYYYFESGDNNK